ncbi:MAG: hypothetical protein OCD01_08025 [Fibrobacterales bacterium]
MQKRELTNEEKQQLFQKLAQWETNPVNQQKIVQYGQALVLKTALHKAEKSTECVADLSGLTINLKTFLPFDFENNQFDVKTFQQEYFQAALTEQGIDFSKALEYKAPIMFLAQLTKSIVATHKEGGVHYLPKEIGGEPTHSALGTLDFDTDGFIGAPPIDYHVIVQNKRGDINSATCTVQFKAQLLHVYTELQEASHNIILSLSFNDGLQPDYFKEDELANFWRQVFNATDRNAVAPVVE